MDPRPAAVVSRARHRKPRRRRHDIRRQSTRWSGTARLSARRDRIRNGIAEVTEHSRDQSHRYVSGFNVIDLCVSASVCATEPVPDGSSSVMGFQIFSQRLTLDLAGHCFHCQLPFVPSNSEHSFVTWRSPLRGDADNDGATAGRAVPSLPGAVAAKPPHSRTRAWIVGTPRPSAASVPAQRHAITTNFIPSRDHPARGRGCRIR